MDNSFIENKDNPRVYWDQGFKYNANYEDIKERWNNSPKTMPTYCYATFHSRIGKSTRKIYFYYPFLPAFALDVISQFNERFNNIKYDVLGNQNLYLAVKYSSYFQSLRGRVWRKETTFPVICPLLTINYSEDYLNQAVYLMNYLLPIFIRMIYPAEKHIDFLETPNNDDLLKWMIDVNNSNLKYRSLSEQTLSLKDFMKLDCIDLMNSLACRDKYIIYSGQTTIMRNISRSENEKPSN